MPDEPPRTNETTDERSGPDVAPRAAAEPTEPDAAAAPLPDRRAFIRQLSGDAVVSAGRIAGLSSVFRRSVLAAGAAATRELQPPLSNPVPDVDPAIGTTAQATGPTPDLGGAEEAARPPMAPPPTVPPPMAATIDAVASLTPEQHAFLVRGTRAVFAVSDPAGAPHVSVSPCHWDGEILRLPSQMFAARAAHVDRDPRVTVLIEDHGSGAWVTVTGIATIVYGADAAADVTRVIDGVRTVVGAVEAWSAFEGRSDAAVIRVRPSRFLWRQG